MSVKIENVYNKVVDNKPRSLLERFKSAYSCGSTFSAIIAIVYMLVDLLFYILLL